MFHEQTKHAFLLISINWGSVWKNISFTTYLGYTKIGKHSVGRDDKKGVFPFQKTEPFDRISTVIWEYKMATLKITKVVHYLRPGNSTHKNVGKKEGCTKGQINLIFIVLKKKEHSPKSIKTD